MTELFPDCRLFTVGHSSHPLEFFLELLKSYQITAVGDVRSSPFSRHYPHYNREILSTALEAAGIRYVSLGLELGARRVEPECYRDGKVRYELIAQTRQFRKGLDRIRSGIKLYRLALVCAEKDPLSCHRTILVCRHLRGDSGPIHHILEDGTIETHTDAEIRLLSFFGLQNPHLFHTRDELIEQAYEIQGARIAFATSNDTEEGPS